MSLKRVRSALSVQALPLPPARREFRHPDLKIRRLELAPGHLVQADGQMEGATVQPATRAATPEAVLEILRAATLAGTAMLVESGVAADLPLQVRTRARVDAAVEEAMAMATVMAMAMADSRANLTTAPLGPKFLE